MAAGAVVTIAFVGYEAADLGCIAPVIAALERDGIARPVVVPGVDFKPHRGLHTSPALAGFEHPAIAALSRAGAARHGGRLDRRARRWTAAPPAAATARQRVVAATLHDLLDGPDMPEIFAAYAEVAHAAADFMRRRRPRLVVLPEDSDYLRGRLLARIVAAHGGRLVCLTPWYYPAFVSYPLVGARLAHHYLVGSRAHAQRLRAAGVAPGAVTVVGHPELDPIAPTPSPPPGRFLYALQGLPWEREIAADLAAILGDEPTARLVIKPHPGLPRPTWLDALAHPRNVRLAPATADTAALLRRTHCVIAQTSRMLWEASLLGRCVVVPHYDATPLGIALPARDRSAVVVRSADALRRLVRATLAGNGRGLHRATIAPHHPQSTTRVVTALRALLRRT